MEELYVCEYDENGIEILKEDDDNDEISDDDFFVDFDINDDILESSNVLKENK